MTEQNIAALVRFAGAVLAVREPHGPLGLTLTGRSDDRPDEAVTVAFSGTAPAGLPERLEDAVVERVAADEYRIASAAGAWRVAARAVHLQREVGQRFYAAIPPRPAPLRRRTLFALMLIIARSRAGIALLRALRR